MKHSRDHASHNDSSQKAFTFTPYKKDSTNKITDGSVPRKNSKDRNIYVCEMGLNLDKVQRLLDMALSIVDSESENESKVDESVKENCPSIPSERKGLTNQK